MSTGKQVPITIFKRIGFCDTALDRIKQKTRVTTWFYTGFYTVSDCFGLFVGADGET